MSEERDLPGAWGALAFQLKTRVLQGRRMLIDWDQPVKRHAAGTLLAGSPVQSEKRAPLWRDMEAAEFPLTAGKVENLRRAAKMLHRIEVPAGQTWSFWKQVGRTTKSKGYVAGRELREGCLVPAIGGGLCQLSGLIYQAALDAGLEVLERHGHSRMVPGSQAEKDLDATVFWNYVDLQLRHDAAWRMEVELTAADVIVRIRSVEHRSAAPATPQRHVDRAEPSGDCLTCGMIECFRHPSATSKHAPSMGHSAFLLDARWPEFDIWCAGHSREGDRWMMPLDGRKWRKPNYHWSPPAHARSGYATASTLWRSLRQRTIPVQGAERQRSLLAGAEALARSYAKRLSPQCRHVVVSQNLLPYLWRDGVLSGRSFDVLMERWPIAELQSRLDRAKATHQESTTLADFRADPALAKAEHEALAAAGRLVTPHRALAAHLGSKAWLLDWSMPEPVKRRPATGRSVFFPFSRLGRKGAFELAHAIETMDCQLRYLGPAEEGIPGLLDDSRCTKGTIADLSGANIVVAPVWVENEPRILLRALASGIPVIATEACGLPEHPHLTLICRPDPEALRDAMERVFANRIDS